ncbi:YbaK/EbsC family protein [Anaerolineae bacterium CFX9]|jgi:prolyl-tRNA editing enzyme YbaK/EbsC (Cys-tRNA(Pro) deacylase)|nr:YbaK/EbsC family protein [Anaerolineae bacterium CFX9]
MQPMTPMDVQAALRAHGLNAEIRFFETSTATSQMAADNIGCQLGQIVKSLCFMVELAEGAQPVLVLTSGDQRVDDRRIAERYGVGRKKVRVASPDECIRIFGYAPGGVPPVGHRTTGLPVYIDATLLRFDQLYAAGGDHNAIFPITPDELERATGGEFVDIVRANGE